MPTGQVSFSLQIGGAGDDRSATQGASDVQPVHPIVTLSVALRGKTRVRSNNLIEIPDSKPVARCSRCLDAITLRDVDAQNAARLEAACRASR